VVLEGFLIEKEKMKMDEMKLYTIKMPKELFQEIYDTAARFREIGIHAKGKNKNDVKMKASNVARLAIREGLKVAESIARAEMEERHADK